MANYNSWLNSEHNFHVTDVEGFKKALEDAGVRDSAKTHDYYGLCYEESDGEFWLGGYDATLIVYGDDGEEIDVAEIIKRFIVPTDHALFWYIGEEKLAVDGAVILITKEKIRRKSFDEVSDDMLNQAGIH